MRIKLLAFAAALTLVSASNATDLPDLASKIINSPQEPTVSGASAKLRKDDRVQGGEALRISVPRKGAHPWDSSLSSAINKPVKAGDKLMLVYWARLEASQSGNTVTLPFAGIALAGPPYTSIMWQSPEPEIGPEWKAYEVSREADRDYPAGTLIANIHLATAKQVIDFGPVVVLDLGRQESSANQDAFPPLPTFTPGPAAVPKTGAALKLGKCVNLSNMLEAPVEGQWGRAFDDRDIGRIKSKGFTAIRLPARFDGHAQLAPPYTIDPAFLARVKHITDLATASGLAVIIDLHHPEKLFKDPQGQRQRLAAMWRQIGLTFKDQPSSVYFELVNEAHDKLDASNLTDTFAPALAAIRESNPTRLVVWGGPSWNSPDEMIKTSFPDDPYVVPTFHYYDPANFTGESASWMTPKSRPGWGSAQDVRDLQAMLDKVGNWMARTGRVPFLGEYGAYEGRSIDQRRAYYRTVSSAFASIGVQSCAWGYTNTFPLWHDPEGWISDLADQISSTTSH